MSEPTGESCWRWYVAVLEGQRYIIARIWGSDADETVQVGEHILELAEGEVEKALAEFVLKKLPSPVD